MSTATLEPETREWTAARLRELAPEQRDEILAAAAERAFEDYTRDIQLTDFEAFREGDLHGTSSNTEPG